MVGAVLIWQREPLGWWLFPLELVLVGSLALGLRWVRLALKPYEIAKTLPDVIESGEYGSRFPAVKQKEIDRVIDAYNRMLANLQHEWLRLGEQRGFLERFLAVTPVGILIFDFDERISLVNPRARELLGGNGDREFAGRTLPGIGSPLANALATLGIDETRMITNAAGRRHRCQRSRFTDRGFNRSYILIEELTAELNRSERETYEKLIRMISHEVTNTVAATNSLLESCRTYTAEFTNDEHRADYENALDVLITRNRNLNEFTKGFSDLVKLPEPQRQDVDVRELLNAMRTMFRAELAERRIEFDVRADDGLPLVSMDRNQMDQVLINVIKNAAEAIGCDGRIEITACLDPGRVDIAISDTGAGLDAETKKSLFTPFFTTKKDGQGLGLTLVREILAQHGFAFSLEPVAGKTQFRIEMPVARAGSSTRPATAAFEPAGNCPLHTETSV
jgi:nitrogen fixation/metabolism regulation signal transduction histidine kinase